MLSCNGSGNYCNSRTLGALHIYPARFGPERVKYPVVMADLCSNRAYNPSKEPA